MKGITAKDSRFWSCILKHFWSFPLNFSRALLRLPLLVSDIFEPTHGAVGHGTRELAGGSSGHCGTDVVVERPLAGLLGLPRVGCGLALQEAANLRTPVLSGGGLVSDLGCGPFGQTVHMLRTKGK